MSQKIQYTSKIMNVIIEKLSCSGSAAKYAATLFLCFFFSFEAAATHRVIGSTPELGNMNPADGVEMRDDGMAGDGVAEDGVFTARVQFGPSTSSRSFGYLVIPSGHGIDGAIGVKGPDDEVLPVPVSLPASSTPLTVEFRFTPTAPEGFGPSSSIADSWNTGFSLDPDLQRDLPWLITGSFQSMLGTDEWDPSSDITLLYDNGAFGDRTKGDGIFSFAFISPSGIEPDGPGTWRVSPQTGNLADSEITLSAEGWLADGTDAETDFTVSAERWEPVLFEVDLLRGMARVVKADHLLDLPMISQMTHRAADGTYVNIMNTADAYLSLEGIYLADDREYFLLPEGFESSIRAWDFNVTFPPGSWIAPNSSITVTATHTYEEFESHHGSPPDFVVTRVPEEPFHMLPAYEGSVGGNRGLTDAGEYIVLYTWVPGMNLVEDLDAIVWASPTDTNLLPLKTGVSVNGAFYGDDAGTLLEDRAPGLTSNGTAIYRQDFRREDRQRMHPCSAPCNLGDGNGYNGVFHRGKGGRFDATDQKLSEIFIRDEADPGAIPLLSVTGTVESPTGELMQGALVTAVRGDEIYSAETSENGDFSIELPHGTWMFTASSFGFASSSRNLRVDHHILLEEAFVLTEADTSWTLSGTVSTAEGGVRISGAVVTAEPGGQETETNVRGEFSMIILEGSYTISTGATGYRPAQKDLVVDRDTYVTFLLEAAASPVSVQGYVRRTDESPIGGAIVRLTDQGGVSSAEHSNTEGFFLFSSVAGEASYSLTVDASGYQSYRGTLEVQDTDITDLIIELLPSEGDFSLSGTVTSSATGEPLHNAALELELPDGVIRSVATNAEGYYIIEELSAGNYEVTAFAIGYNPLTNNVIIEGNTELDFSLIPSGTTRSAISGTVSLDDQPEDQWPGSTVTASGPEQLSVITGEGGAYSFSGVTNGTYVISVSRSGYETQSETIELNSDTVLDFKLLPSSDDEDGSGCDCSQAGTGNLIWVFLPFFAPLFRKRFFKKYIQEATAA